MNVLIVLCQGSVQALMRTNDCNLDALYCLLENFQTLFMGLFGISVTSYIGTPKRFLAAVY